MAKDQFKDNYTIRPFEQTNPEEKELKIIRTFNAPKELMYKAFIDPEYLGRWYGTYNCLKSECEVDPTVGGKVSIQMTLEGGKQVSVKGEFQELVENEKLVFTTGTSGPTSDFDVVNLNTVVFEEANGKTKLTLLVKMIKVPDKILKFAFKGMIKAWPESLDRLEEFLSSEFANNE